MYMENWNCTGNEEETKEEVKRRGGGSCNGRRGGGTGAAVAIAVAVCLLSLRERAEAAAGGARRDVSENLEERASPGRWQAPLVEMGYGGGRVMDHPMKLYLIWYGAWDGYSQGIIRSALRSLTPPAPGHAGGEWSPNLGDWWKIATRYSEWPPWGAHVTNNISIAGELSNLYSHGRTLDLSSPSLQPLKDIVASSISLEDLGATSHSTDNNNATTFQYDEHGVYMLLLGFDVAVTAPQRLPFCAFHSYLCLAGNGSDPISWTDPSTGDDCGLATANKAVYSFAPFFSESNFFDNCILFDDIDGGFWPPPNGGNGALDSMVSAMLHELAEAATNPYGNAWVYNRSENSGVADMCTNVFGPGGWYYCGLPDPYGDFYSSQENQCSDFGAPLVDPKSNVLFNVYGENGLQFLVQYLWSLDSGGCQLQSEERCRNGIREDQTKSVGGGVVEVGYFARVAGSATTVGMQSYAAGLNCSWLVNVTEAKLLSISFSPVNTDFGWDFLRLSTPGTTAGQPERQLLAIAGSIPSPEPRIIAGSAVVISFHSDPTRSPPPTATGWQLTYTPGYCLGTVELTGIEGEFSDGTPDGQNYASGLNCSWILSTTSSASISVVFTRLDIGPQDTIAIYNGDTAVITKQLRQITGSPDAARDSLPGKTTCNGSMLVTFITRTSAGTGWSAVYGPTASIAIAPAPKLDPLHTSSPSSSAPPFANRSLSSLRLLLLLLGASTTFLFLFAYSKEYTQTID